MNCEFEKIVGSLLVKAIGAVHYFDGNLDVTPEYLTLKFEGKEILSFSGETDGWHIRVNQELIEPIDMQESGEIVLCDLSKKPPFSKFVGERVIQLLGLISKQTNNLIGFRFEFPHESSLIILNWGDELFISDKYPSDEENGNDFFESKMDANR